MKVLQVVKLAALELFKHTISDGAPKPEQHEFPHANYTFS